MLESIWLWIAISFVAGVISSTTVSCWKARVHKKKLEAERIRKKRLRAAVVRKILLERARRRKEKLSDPSKQSQPDNTHDKQS